MKITEHEMRGLLAGKCLPGDMRVNEDLSSYLVRKFSELQQKLDSESLEKDYNADQIIYWKEQAGLLKQKTEATERACAAFRNQESKMQQKLDAIGQSAQWKPEICTITRRPFFMWIEHPSDGMVPTYGGPLDSYTIPVLDIDGEFCCERFDHDEGCWVDSECVGVRLTNDQEPVIDTAYLNSVRAEGVDSVAMSLAKIPWREMHISGQRHYYIQRSEAILTAEDIAARLRSGTHDTADKAG